MLSEQEQRDQRARMAEHWQHSVVFNRHLGLVVQRWDADGVEIRLPYRDEWSASDGYLHGGALATLIDTTGCGAGAAGDDSNNGSRTTTVSLSVQYLSFARREDVVATGY